MSFLDIAHMEKALQKPALQYFDYLSRRFPVMCASDEFHFLPGAEKANRYYDQLEDFERQISRFQLNPGYQLCYSPGRFEILKRCFKTRKNRTEKSEFFLQSY